MGQSQYRKSLRVSERQREELLSQLDRVARGDEFALGSDDANRRQDKRWKFREPSMAMTVEHPAGGVARLIVGARNISAGGIAFLHGGFLHPRSRCRMVLNRLDGQREVVAGSVVNCRHVSGAAHEISVRFDHRIDPTNFVCIDQAPVETNDAQTLELPDLRGRILYVEDAQADQVLMRHYLEATGVTLTIVASAAEAAAKLAESTFDFVLADLNLPDAEGIAVVEQIRAANFKGSLAVVTAENSPSLYETLRAAGVAHILAKPYNPGKLHELIKRLHEELGVKPGSATIYSAYEGQPNMSDLILSYIQRAHELASELEEAVGANDLNAVRQVCLKLKGSAGGYGFNPVSELAAQAIESIDASRALESARQQLNLLSLMCNNLGLRRGKFIRRPDADDRSSFDKNLKL